MKSAVWFPSSAGDLRKNLRHFSGARAVRLPLSIASTAALPPTCKRWLDPEIEALYYAERISGPSKQTLESTEGFSEIATTSFLEKPDKSVLMPFVETLMDRCLKEKPDWISVPQLPVPNGSERNKINRQMAEITGKWAKDRSFQGRLVLPAIFTNQKQLNRKTERNPKLTALERAAKSSGASAIWAVDASLTDYLGSKTFEQKRFPGVLGLHADLKEKFPGKLIIGGPYWGLNLVLWAKGAINHPGIGTSFRYLIQGGIASRPKSRIALRPLRRLVVYSPELKDWLRAVARKKGHGQSDFRELLHPSGDFAIPEAAKNQILRFYAGWVDDLTDVSEDGRSLALYQDFSSAYVLGQSLSRLPRSAGLPSAPGEVAKQLMLFCL